MYKDVDIIPILQWVEYVNRMHANKMTKRGQILMMVESVMIIIEFHVKMSLKCNYLTVSGN